MVSAPASTDLATRESRHSRAGEAWQWACALPLLVQDAWLYAGSCVFALLLAAVTTSADYRAWGEMAGVAYAVGLGACLVGARLTARAPLAAGRLRRAVLLALLLSVVAAPLGAELAWRAEAVPGGHAQPEVAVIEAAGDRAAAGESPYLNAPSDVGVAPQSDARGIDTASFFPYLPGMVVFGLPSAYSAAGALGDARLGLVLFSLVIAAIALYFGREVLRLRTRVVQVLFVLPFGALPMATGGDDLPVLALVFFGLVLAAKRHPVSAGLVLGAAATLKFTAWPVLLLLAFAVRDADGRRAVGRYALAAAVVSVPVTLIGLFTSPRGFFENVVRFPLGLASVRSPAASPLLGQVLTTLLPGDRRLVTMLLAVAGAVVVVGLLVYRSPRTVAAVAGMTAFVLLLATLLAPATRFGYLIYPANLAVWAAALSRPDGAFGGRVSRRRRVRTT